MFAKFLYNGLLKLEGDLNPERDTQAVAVTLQDAFKTMKLQLELSWTFQSYIIDNTRTFILSEKAVFKRLNELNRLSLDLFRDPKFKNVIYHFLPKMTVKGCEVYLPLLTKVAKRLSLTIDGVQETKLAFIVKQTLQSEPQRINSGNLDGTPEAIKDILETLLQEGIVLANPCFESFAFDNGVVTLLNLKLLAIESMKLHDYYHNYYNMNDAIDLEEDNFMVFVNQEEGIKDFRVLNNHLCIQLYLLATRKSLIAQADITSPEDFSELYYLPNDLKGLSYNSNVMDVGMLSRTFFKRKLSLNIIERLIRENLSQTNRKKRNERLLETLCNIDEQQLNEEGVSIRWAQNVFANYLLQILHDFEEVNALVDISQSHKSSVQGLQSKVFLYPSFPIPERRPFTAFLISFSSLSFPFLLYHFELTL